MITARCFKKISGFLLISVAPFISFHSAHATEPWPGEAVVESTILTHLDSGFQSDLSGAHWNPVTRTLWVCINKGPETFWALKEDGSGSFKIDEDASGNKAKWTDTDDLEGITQVDLTQPYVYLVHERKNIIRQFDVSDFTQKIRVHFWNVQSIVGDNGNTGLEGITFVPDEWLLRKGFKDKDGNLYTSQKGMGGLMFVARELNGRIFTFDLNPDTDNDFIFVGEFETSRNQIAGLEFDRSNGMFYILHNTGANFLEITDLSSIALNNGRRRFNALTEYLGPNNSNLEGFALSPAADNENWAFLTDDANKSGRALMWFDEFIPDVPGDGNFIYQMIDASNNDATETVGTVLLDGNSLVLADADSAITGIRFSGFAIPAGASINRATVQFTAHRADNVNTNIDIWGELSGNSVSFTTGASDLSTRARTKAQVSWMVAEWGKINDDGLSQESPDLSAIIQEIIDRNSWTPGNPLTLLVSGNGNRIAKSFDGDSRSAPQLIIEYSVPDNQPPVLNVGQNQSILLTESARLQGAIYDDGLPLPSNLSLTWSKFSGPGDVTFGDINALSTMASFSAQGIYVLKLSANDGGLTGNDSITITVNDDPGNSQPVVIVEASDTEAFEEGLDVGSYTFSRTGPTSSALTLNYTLTGTATNGVDYQTKSGIVKIKVNQSSRTIHIVPLEDTVDEGDETVILTLEVNANYNIGVAGSATVNIIDNDGAANKPPFFTSETISNKPVATVDSDYSASLASDASDPEDGDLRFTKKSGADWLNVANDGTLSGTPTASDIGENSFNIIVEDDGGLTAEAGFKITVEAAAVQKSSGGGAFSWLELLLLLVLLLAATAGGRRSI